MIEQVNRIAEIWWNWMWPMFWQVSVLIGFIALIDFLIRKHVWPQVRYALWLLVLAKLLLPPSFALRTGVVSHVQPLVERSIRQPVATGGSMAYPSIDEHLDWDGLSAEELVRPQMFAEPVLGSEPVESSVQVNPSGQTTRGGHSSFSWHTIAMIVWIVVTLLLMLRLIARHRMLLRAHYVDRHGHDLPKWLPQLLDSTARKLRLKRMPKIVLSSTVSCPAVLGILRPLLLVPATNIERLSLQETEHILLHELAHIKRRDLPVHALCVSLQIFYWFNPLLNLVRRQLQHLRELCCDATVAGILKDKTEEYCQTILKTVEWLLNKPRPCGIGLLGLIEDPDRLRIRLKWLQKKPSKYPILRIAVVFFVVVTMFAFVLPMAEAQKPANRPSTTNSADVSGAKPQYASQALNPSFLDTLPDKVFKGEGKGDVFSANLGTRGEAIGDLNGDGFDDIVIGAPNYNHEQGRVYVYFGGKDISTEPDLVFTGETNETHLGMGVTLGDVNKDGYDDLVIGGWGYNAQQGRAYLYYGGKTFDTNYDKIFEGEKGIAGRFGLRVVLGDVNNDGFADLAVAAEGYGAPQDSPDPYSGQGRIYLYYGAAGMDMDTTPDKILEGEKSGGVFGRHLAMGKDVDGDGCGELLIGAAEWNNRRGRAYLYYGGPDTTMGTVPGLTFTGENVGDRFSRDLGMGDINGDGHADIVLGAARYKVGQGRAYVYYGAPRKDMNVTYDYVIDGKGGNDRADFGIGVAIGDLDNDGCMDLLIGGDDCYNYRGRVCLYYGGRKFDSTCDLVFDGEAARNHFGRCMDIGDINGDKYPDIIIGAWSYNEKQGRAYLYYGGPRRAEPIQLVKSLLEAASAGDTKQVESLVSKGADINTEGESGNAPLHRAAENGHKEVVELLIDKGAKVNSKNAMGDTALHIAAHNGRVDVAELLIAKGAHVNARRHFGGTPLHCAVWGGRYQEVTELLLAKGADVNVKDESGDTPLHYAAGYIFGGNRDSMVKLLIAKGAIADSKNRLGQTPADFALTHPGIPTVLRLLATKDASVPNLHVAAFMGDSAKVQSFIEQGSDVNEKFGRIRTPLHYAAMAGSKEAAELLLAKGADVNAKGGWDYTPLYYAVYSGSKDMVELLLSKGADVNAKDTWGRTPIDLAMNQGRKEIAKLLIAKGADVSTIHSAAFIGSLEKLRSLIEADADVNVKDTRGRTALYYAAREGYKEIVELLLAHGADVNSKDRSRRTSLHNAARQGHKEVVEVLLANGSDVNSEDRYYKTPTELAMGGSHSEVVELLIAKGASIPGLCLAAYRGDYARVKDLIEDGADVNIRTKNGVTPLYEAALQGYKDIAELLIEKGADVNTKDNWDWTPLHSAAEEGHEDMVELLIAKGANVNAKDGDSRTPLWYAQDEGHTEIAELLRKHGAKE